MTLVSRISGLVRDVVTAWYAGSGVFADVFFVAFRIPNLFRRIFAEGAFSIAFVPVMSEHIERGDVRATERFTAQVCGLLALALALFVLLGMAFAPLVLSVVAPGFSGDPQKMALAVESLRLTFPYLFFISLVALSAGLLHTAEKFAIAAVTPVFLNICIVGSVLVFADSDASPSYVLSLGVLIAGAVQLAFQIPFLIREGLLPKPTLPWSGIDDGVRKVLRLMGPSIFGASVAQINMLVNTLIASFLVTGSISWLYYSDRLMEFPIGVIAVALGTVILPALSKRHQQDKPAVFSAIVDWGLRLALVVSLPAAVALGCFAEPLLTVLFQYGELKPSDVEMSAKSLRMFALGLPFIVSIKIFAPAFYARQDTRTPVRIGIAAMICNMLIGATLAPFLGHVGLAIAFCLSSVVNACLLGITLYRRDVYRPERALWSGFLLKVGLAATLMGAVLLYAAADSSRWFDASLWQRLAMLGGWGGAAAVIYFGVLWSFGFRPSQFKTPAAHLG
ncbi:murein biosynthesis integral membrane protein MurJ [Gammaproteobacteria bacterium]|nr:murein biosynthesis integral membrane protein MurJ [Gammaproteobacteria bacterium]